MTRNKILHILFVVILILPAVALPGTQARAGVQGTILVNTTEDELNADGDCSLREAIQAANTDTAVDACPAGGGADIISIPAGLYSLTLGLPGEDANQGGDLDITQDLTILGDEQAGVIIDGNANDRVIHIFGSKVTIARLTIRNGYLATGTGAGIAVNSTASLVLNRVTLTGNEAASSGGALDNTGTLQMRDVLFTNNAASSGGALLNTGSLKITGATFANNAASLKGGGIDNSNPATLTNVTFSGNTAQLYGGGMFNDGNDVRLTNVTFTNNSTAIRNNGNLYLLNTIVTGSTAGSNYNCSGMIDKFYSLGHNLDSGNSCNFTHLGDLVNTDPLLGPLGDYQGPTPTHPLLEGSPAIDAGTNQNCPSTDQRGVSRPADGNNDSVKTCDIGAFEFNGVFLFFIYMPITNR